MVFLFSVVSFCSDGVDRYRKFGPNTLYLFAEPSPGCGYGVLPKDSEGGADGTIEFRWVQEHMQALVRVCAYRTEKEFGPSKYPLTIFDGSAENGDTPVDWEPAPLGRHPGGSHDGGINLDLGYYLTSLEGKRFTPDYAACTDHFVGGGDESEDSPESDAYICVGPADRLDTPRMSYFYIRMFSINRELFGSALLGQIGADYFVREAVIKQLENWVKEKKHGATQEILDDFKRVVTCDEYEGWAGSHHHHTHIRLNDIDLYGSLRPAIEKLLEMERDVDLALAEGKPFLRARLLSSGLERAVEAEILGDPHGAAIVFQAGVYLQVGRGNEVPPQRGDQRNRAVMEVKSGPVMERQKLDIAAKLVPENGSNIALKSDLTLPVQDPRLYISIDPLRINAEAVLEKNEFVCKLSYPPVYKSLVTDAFFEVAWKGYSSKFYLKDGSARIPADLITPFIINACVTTCGRKTFRIPVYVEPAQMKAE